MWLKESWDCWGSALCAPRSFYKVEQGLEFLFLASGALLLSYNLFIKLLPVHSLSRESSSDYFRGKVCEAPVCWDSGMLHLCVSPGSVFQLAVIPMDDNPCSSGAVSKRRDIPLCLWSNLRMNLWLPRNRNMETYWGVALWQVVFPKRAVQVYIYFIPHVPLTMFLIIFLLRSRIYVPHPWKWAGFYDSSNQFIWWKGFYLVSEVSPD